MTKQSNQIQLTLPRPHPAQQTIINESKRFNVLACGRRFGKTQLGIDRVINKALHAQPTAWCAPTYKMLMDVWRELTTVLTPVTSDKSESEKRVELRGGGTIECWSMDSAGDSVRGRRYALLVIDEAAIVPDLQQAWESSLRPTLADLKGECWFLSTPRGQNYFQRLYARGRDFLHRNWASWQMPTSANPYISPEEIEAARADLSEALFRQEYEGSFENWEGAVFRHIMESATATTREGPEPGHVYQIGCDWGRSLDFTVFAVLDSTTNTMVAMERSNQVDYTVQRQRLVALRNRWKPRTIIAEMNSIGQPIIEALVREGLPIQPFTTTNASKAQAIEALALAFERGDIKILNDPVLLAELQAFSAERLPSGLMRYSAPSGGHDDTVMALALAWQLAGGRREPHHGLFNVWREDAQKIRDENKPGAIVTHPAINPAERAREIGQWQKDASNFTEHIPTFGRKPTAALPAPPVCDRCGNENVSLYAESWWCVCGGTGTWSVVH